jgi:hypothetical protein
MHACPHASFKPRLAILRAEDEMKDDFTERLRHGVDDDQTGAESESRFQR